MAIRYDIGTGTSKNWIITETAFDPLHLGKCEAMMALANGYMGIRSATEETYVNETRNAFIAGVYNKFDATEVSEMPNIADITAMNILINGENFSLERGDVRAYQRELNLKTGELTRSVIWVNPNGYEFRMVFRRFVSMANLHLTGTQVEITPLSSDAVVTVQSGINGQMTNSGAQHFHEGEKGILDKTFLRMVQTTTLSKVHVVSHSAHKFLVDGRSHNNPRMDLDRRYVHITEKLEVRRGQTLTIEKMSTFYTGRDKIFEGRDVTVDRLKDVGLKDLKEAHTAGYSDCFNQSAAVWETLWSQMNIAIKGSDFDQLAIRFAEYHLLCMVPAHDDRYSIGVRGLTGEGYRGHTYWDVEIFLLPFYTCTFPDKARNLLKFRYLGLDGARKKAKSYGFEGAMFPWETTFDGEEESPERGFDLVYGKEVKFEFGDKEQHVTSGIIYGLWQYYTFTGDQAFMDDYGYEMVFETARFWASRVEWKEERCRYELTDVFGPDEYKQHVDNNAYTNYMAYWNIQLAIDYTQALMNSNRTVYDRLDSRLNLTASLASWTNVAEHLYLPEPREEDRLLPQDDTYLTLDEIDLTKYRHQKNVLGIFHDYNWEALSNIQISKQADVLMLFYLLEDMFSEEVKKANWDYYEPRTIHDSAVSLSSHAVLACDMKSFGLAYELFRRASTIDLGPKLNSSDEGIHAGAVGGIWQCVVNGFGGVRMLGGRLLIRPELPEQWTELKFPLYWHGNQLEVTVTKKVFKIHFVTPPSEAMEVMINGDTYKIDVDFSIDL